MDHNDNDTGSTELQRTSSSSAASRVISATASMARRLLAQPPKAEDLSLAFADAKVSSSSSSSGPTQASGSLSGWVDTQSGGRQHRQVASDPEYFGHSEASFSRFVNETGAWMPRNLQTTSNPGASGHQGKAGRSPELDVKASAASEHERLDGQEVVSLLSRNSEGYQLSAGEDSPLSPREAADLRRALFGTSGPASASCEATPWRNNTLNFIPKQLRETEPGHSTTAEWNEWLDQWTDVLTRYTDEVWGNLADLVGDARMEIRQLEKRGPYDDKLAAQTLAVRRLQSIMGHLAL